MITKFFKRLNSSVRSVAFYAKSAYLAVGDSVIETITSVFNGTVNILIYPEDFVIFVPFTCYLLSIPFSFMFGFPNLAIGLCAISAVPISIYSLVKMRVNYIKRLGTLISEKLDKAEEVRLTFISDNANSLKEKCLEEVDLLIKEKKEMIEKIFSNIKMPIFKATKGEQSLYIVGSIHFLPHKYVPASVKSKIDVLAKDQHCFAASEFDRGDINIARNLILTPVKFIQKFMVAFFHSPLHTLKCLIKPNYFSQNIDPKLAYLIHLYAMGNTILKYDFMDINEILPEMENELTLDFSHSMAQSLYSVLVNDTPFDYTMLQSFPNERYFALELQEDVERAQSKKKITRSSEEISKLFDRKYESEKDSILQFYSYLKDKNFPKLVAEFSLKQNIEVLEKYTSGNVDVFSTEIKDLVGSALEDSPLYKKNKESSLSYLHGFNKSVLNLKFDLLLFATARNLNWIPRIKELCEKQKRGVILAGFGHLYGELGILNLLQKEGFRVERVVRMPDEPALEDEKTTEELRLTELRDKPIVVNSRDYLPLLNSRTISYYARSKIVTFRTDHDQPTNDDKKERLALGGGL